MRLWIRTQADQAGIADHANDLPYRRITRCDRTVRSDAFTNGILARKKFACEAFVHDCHRRCLDVVARAKIATAEKRHTQGLKIIEPDCVHLGDGTLCFRYWALLNFEVKRNLAATKGNPPGRAGVSDARQRGDALEQSGIEVGHLLRLSIAFVGQRKTRGHDIGRIKAGPDLL